MKNKTNTSKHNYSLITIMSFIVLILISVLFPTDSDALMVIIPGITISIYYLICRILDKEISKDCY